MNKTQNKWARLLIFIILSIFAVFALFPLVYMVISSLKSAFDFTNYPFSLPKEFYFDNYKALYFRFDVARIFGNTFFCVAFALLLSLCATIPASYAFSKLRFKFRGALYITVIATMTIPGVTFLIPNYLFMTRLGLVDQYWSVILLWATFSIPNNIFLLTSLMRGLPNEILEAVKMDGGNYYSLMTKIVVPMSVPGIVTVSIFNTTGWWNDLLTPLIFLQSDVMKTMTVAAATILGRFNNDYPLLLAGLFMTALPPIVIYISLQGHIRKGLVIGSVK